MARPAREFIGSGKPLVLCLDSGGGSWLHLSPSFLKICLKFGIKPFYYPAWTTKAICPLDQTVHSTAARLWAEWKQLWGHKQQPLTLFIALKAAGQIVDEALKADLVKASWAQVGIRLNEKFDYDKLFVQRKAEIFQSMRDAPQTPASSKALCMVQDMSPKKTKHSCGTWIGVDCKFCCSCGESNPDYDEETASLLRKGHRAGWKKPEPLEECSDAPDSGLLLQLDDLMKELRKRSDSKQTPKAPTVAGSSSTDLAPVETPLETTDAEKQPEKHELDLDAPEDVVEYLKCYWSKDKVKNIEVTLRFAVEAMKARATKSEPLSHIVQKEIIKSKILMKKDGRSAWLASWADKRSLKFVPKPNFGVWYLQQPNEKQKKICCDLGKVPLFVAFTMWKW